MPIVIRYSLNRQSTIHDLTERAEFFQSLTAESGPILVDSQLKTHIALKAISKALTQKTHLLNPAIKNSAAFIALEQNLCEYIKNSFDANATQITISICDEIRNGHVIIHYHDNGDAFKPSMLINDKIHRDYHELINHASHFASTKEEERQAGKTHLQGSTGLGLAFTSAFLKEHGGKLLIGTSPKLIIRSTPYIDLRKAFRETRNIALRKLACTDDHGRDSSDQVDFSEVEEYGQVKPAVVATQPKNKSFGLKLDITAKLSDSLSSTDKSSGSESASKTHQTPSRFFVTPRSHSTSSAGSPIQTPTPRIVL